MKTLRSQIAALVVLSALAPHLAATAGLIHRYSFDETAGATVSDSAGTAHGVIRGNGAYFDGAGRLYLPGLTPSDAAPETIAGYVDLPNRLISVLDSVTVETWVTWDGSGSWQRIFDFGTSAGGEDISNGEGNYLFLSPQGPANLRFAVRDPATGTEPTQLTAGAPLAPGEQVCVTVTYDPAANTARLYSNAVLLATGPAGIALRDINDVNNWIGRSQWGPDGMFQGSYDEFRIYNAALNPVEVAASFVAGPGLPSTDPTRLGALLAVNLMVARTTMTETDTQPTTATADFANFQGVMLAGVPGVMLESDNPAVLTVDAAGVFTAVKPGVAKVTLSYQGKTDQETITVNARQTGIVVAGALVVDLRAADVSADATVWPNRVRPDNSDDFYAVGAPTYVANVAGTGVAGVQFNPTAPATDAYVGPITTAELHGNSDRSIEVWAYNPAIADEETLVAWGRRGGPEGSNLSFNYGANATWGAVGHWGSPDMGWSGTPPAGRWHYLVYAYDGLNTVKVYADGILKTTRTLSTPLNTHPDLPIRLAAQANTSGTDFEFAQALSGYLALVRVHTGKLTDADVANNFLYGPTLSPPGELQTVRIEVSRPTIYGVRDVGQARVIADFANLKGVDVTGFSALQSSDPNVVRVNAAGTYTAVAVGTAELRATYQGRPLAQVITVAEPPPLALKHRYSFSETGGATVNDSVGNAHGEIMGNGASFSGGSLILPGGGVSTDTPETIAGYVNLPNGIISPLVNVSFEAWVTWNGSGSWQRIFDFGTSAAGEEISTGQGNYLFMSPAGPSNLRFAVRDPRTGTEPTQLTASRPLPNGDEVYVAAVYNFTANQARLYSNAVQVASGPAAVPLAIINDVNNWLGRSQWPDGMFQGSYNEVRIWQGALSPEQVAANFAAGPDTVPEPPVQAPTLTIALAGNNIVLGWPANATGFALEATGSLAPPVSWNPVDASGAVEQGGQKRLTLTIGPAAQFYRMRK
jgi:hypothetical protein